MNAARSATLPNIAGSVARTLRDGRSARMSAQSEIRGRILTRDTSGTAVGFATVLGSVSAAWPDELWAGSVGWADAVLRYYYGIYEFTDDPNCVLRIGLGEAHAPVSLSDGTNIEIGELVGTLHFWNEHLPRYSERGPDLGWACAMRDRVRYSLRAFSEYVEREAGWQNVRAIRTETAIPARLGASQIMRVFRRYGFERVPSEHSLVARLHGLGDCVVVWALTRAFNPAALPRQPFLRDRHELWISKATLLSRYARRNRQATTGTAWQRGV
jgi:hypothetical protein